MPYFYLKRALWRLQRGLGAGDTIELIDKYKLDRVYISLYVYMAVSNLFACVKFIYRPLLVPQGFAGARGP